MNTWRIHGTIKTSLKKTSAGQEQRRSLQTTCSTAPGDVTL